MTLDEMISVVKKNGINREYFVKSQNQFAVIVKIHHDGLVYGKTNNGEMITCHFDEISFDCD